MCICLKRDPPEVGLLGITGCPQERLASKCLHRGLGLQLSPLPALLGSSGFYYANP